MGTFRIVAGLLCCVAGGLNLGAVPYSKSRGQIVVGLFCIAWGTFIVLGF